MPETELTKNLIRVILLPFAWDVSTANDTIGKFRSSVPKALSWQSLAEEWSRGCFRYMQSESWDVRCPGFGWMIAGSRHHGGAYVAPDWKISNPSRVESGRFR